ncbi:hypothetical protein G4B88_019361 [Cannabis sativa]|uniref:Chaperone DnaJ C-terminal domain-containing protein n=1 Tax=Cannabis sativa TaxID=3483 RepID=A0A7J6HXZ4_CANSA|nr:hypothetical protein G4B88_019361 [Cannabis sativa]
MPKKFRIIWRCLRFLDKLDRLWDDTMPSGGDASLAFRKYTIFSRRCVTTEEAKLCLSVPYNVRIDSGDTIRVPGAGNTGGQGSEPGTLYIKLKVAKDPIFARDGADVYVDSNISFTQVPRLRCSGHFTANMTLLAILGGKVEVPTLSGKTQLFTYSSLLVIIGFSDTYGSSAWTSSNTKRQRTSKARPSY